MLKEKDTTIHKSSISQATSDGEIAEFWDEHSLADYWEETALVEFDVNIQSGKTYCRLEKSLSEQLSQEAIARGISLETLVNLWLQEKLLHK